MMTARVAGLVLRTGDKHLTARFYKELGLAAREHEHGGPKHYEVGPLSEDCVLEIYQASERISKDTLMLEVASIKAALLVAGRFGIKLCTELKEVGDARFVYITDPDGRYVMLIERKQKLNAATSASLRELRERVRMTQANLAAKLGCTQASVSMVERSQNVRLSTLHKVVAALGGRLDVFVRIGGETVALRSPEPGDDQS